MAPDLCTTITRCAAAAAAATTIATTTAPATRRCELVPPVLSSSAATATTAAGAGGGTGGGGSGGAAGASANGPSHTAAPVTAMVAQFNRRGHYVATGYYDGSVLIWDFFTRHGTEADGAGGRDAAPALRLNAHSKQVGGSGVRGARDGGAGRQRHCNECDGHATSSAVRSYMRARTHAHPPTLTRSHVHHPPRSPPSRGPASRGSSSPLAPTARSAGGTSRE